MTHYIMVGLLGILTVSLAIVLLIYIIWLIREALRIR